ncbi:MAG: hypothetical protein WCJ88_12315 [Actinomycetes bacterium]
MHQHPPGQTSRIPGPVLRGGVVPYLQRVAPHDASIEELLRHLADLGLRFEAASLHDRPGKRLSDALRWSERRGFIERTGRGRYRYVHVPRTTLWRMQDRCKQFLVDSQYGPNWRG